MRALNTILLLASFFIPGFSQAQNATSEEAANGNLIQEPTLSDYSAATRTPGFSQITDVVTENGQPL